MINTDNWNYSQYTSGIKRAFISLGAAPVSDSDDVKISYLVTVSDENNNDLFQKDFLELSAACEDINSRYGHWKLSDARLAKNTGSGCDTCEAH